MPSISNAEGTCGRSVRHARDINLVLEVEAALKRLHSTEQYALPRLGDVQLIAKELGICRQAVGFALRALGCTTPDTDPRYYAVRKSLTKDVYDYLEAMQPYSYSCEELLCGRDHRAFVARMRKTYEVSGTTMSCWIGAIVIARELAMRGKSARSISAIDGKEKSVEPQIVTAANVITQEVATVNISTKPNQTNNPETLDQETSGSQQAKVEMSHVNLQVYQYLDLELVLAIRQFVQAWRTQPENGRITHTKIARALGVSNRIVSCAYQALNWKINSSSAESTFDSVRDELTHRLQEFNAVHVGASRRSPEYRQFFLGLCRHYNVAATTMHYWLTAVKLGAEVKAHDAAIATTAAAVEDSTKECAIAKAEDEDEDKDKDEDEDEDGSDMDIVGQENEEAEEPAEEPKPSDNALVMQIIKSIERVSVVLITALAIIVWHYLQIKSGH